MYIVKTFGRPNYKSASRFAAVIIYTLVSIIILITRVREGRVLRRISIVSHLGIIIIMTCKYDDAIIITLLLLVRL